MVKTKKRNYIKNKNITKKKDCGCKYGGTKTNMGPPAPKYPPKKLARLPELQSSEEYFQQVTGHNKDVVDALLEISKTNKPKTNKPKTPIKRVYKTKKDLKNEFKTVTFKSPKYKPSEETINKFQMPQDDNTKLIGGLEPFIQVEEEINSPQIIIIHNDDEHDQRKLFDLLMGFTGMIAISATAIAYSIINFGRQ